MDVREFFSRKETKKEDIPPRIPKNRLKCVQQISTTTNIAVSVPEVTVSVPEVSEEKVDSKTYMRNYKKKKYVENPQQILELNKAYYYKYKCGFDSNMMAKYKTLLPYVGRIRTNIDEFKQKDIRLCIEYISTILEELQIENSLTEIEK